MIIVDVPAKFGLERFRETAQLLEDGRLLFDSFEMTDNPFTDSCL